MIKARSKKSLMGAPVWAQLRAMGPAKPYRFARSKYTAKIENRRREMSA